MSKWYIREYKPEDAESIRKLFVEVYHKSLPSEVLIWKFHKNPAGQGIVMVAEDSNKIVGQFALMPMWLRLGNEVVLGAQSLDTMTHPSYRNQGMFILLAKACMTLAKNKGIEVLYGFPNEYSYHGFVNRLNWDYVGSIPNWVRVLKSDGFTSYPSLIRQIMSLGLPFLPIGHSNFRGIEIRVEAPIKDEVVSLVNSTFRDKESEICRVERSKEWVKWRFDPASQRHYVWFSAYRDGKLAACAVLRISDWATCTPVVDVLGVDTRALEIVVSKATRYAKQIGLPLVAAVTNYTNVERALKSCGYFRRGSSPLIIRSLTSRLLSGNIRLYSSWGISSADVDTF